MFRRGANDLWASSSQLLYATSVVPHAAFKNGKPFAGPFDARMSQSARTGNAREKDT